MAKLEALLPGSKAITTKKSGKKYSFCRPFVLIWKKYNLLIRTLEGAGVEAAAAQTMSDEFLTEYAEFLLTWIRENHPEITIDEIEREFDLGDIPEIKRIAAEFYAEIVQAAPPGFDSGEREEEPAAETS